MTEEGKEDDFPSEHLRYLLAPLASLEDLASDELESPSSIKEKVDGSDSDNDNLNESLDNIDVCETVSAGSVFTAVPQTGYSSGFVTPEFDKQFESDVDSQGTLTPCEGVKSQTPSSIRTGSFSSLLKTQRSEQVEDRRKNLSADSILSAYDDQTSSEKSHKRKSSWTDIFRSRSRSQSRSPQGSPKSYRNNTACSTDEKSSKKKEKGGLFSLFRFGGRKSPRSKTPSPTLPYSPPSMVNKETMDTNIFVPESDFKKSEPEKILIIETLNDDKEIRKLKNENIKYNHEEIEIIEDSKDGSDGLEYQVNEKEIESKEETEKSEKELSLESKFIYSLQHEISERQRNGISEQENQDILTQVECISVIEDHASSESELDFEDVQKNHVKRRESEEDYEAETLLAQESLDDDDLPPSNFQIPVSSVKSSLPKLPTRQQRLEVSTIPVERPRSTTPISIAPLEAFIRSASSSPDPHVEKIHLSLPGEEFSFKLKSPKKVNLKNWVDFCEKGLQSPRIPKKPQVCEDLDDKDKITHNHFPDSALLKNDSWSNQKPENELMMETVLQEAQKITAAFESAWMTSETQIGNIMQRKFSDAAFSEIENIESFERASSDSSTNSSSIPLHLGGNNIVSGVKTDVGTKSSILCPCECHSCGCGCHYITVDLSERLRQTSPWTLENQSAPITDGSDIDFSVETCSCECHFESDVSTTLSERSLGRDSEEKELSGDSGHVQEQHLAIKEGSEFQF